jgi:hypothetical protein
MRITATDQLALGVVDAVVPEPGGGAQKDTPAAAKRIRDAVVAQLERLTALPTDELVAARYRRYRELGAYRTAEGVEGVHVPDRPSLAERLRQLIDAGVGRIGGGAETTGGQRVPAGSSSAPDRDAPLREDV